MKRFKATLTADERQDLRDLIAAGKGAARKLTHARILLKADTSEGGLHWPDWRIAEKLEIHHTPKHGSWLNMAEIELSVLARQCLDRRIETKEDLEQSVAAWEEARNERGGQIKWRFTTADARIKLRRLYLVL